MPLWDMKSMDDIFNVDNVSFAYDGHQPALDVIQLDIRRGEKLIVLGANGSGKSTLLKLLDGLYFATSGRVLFDGVPLTEEAFLADDFHYSFRRRVGLVFQDSEVQLFCPSVWDEVAFAPLQIGLPQTEVKARVEGALAALRIEKLADRAPHRLSGGEKKRVALASILSLDPEVWLLDEPTAGLDPRNESWLEDFIHDQGRQGRTVVAATHDLALAGAVADRLAVFDEDHHLAAVGTPSEILSDMDLLISCNLVHAHRHSHPGQTAEHTHPHLHHAGEDTAHDHHPGEDRNLSV
jgi:cobalt/nickel transport system ATP-binding protein